MDPDERDSVATQFGVSTEQVQRDHLVSHILAFLSHEFGDRIHFIGGTALARTHLPDGRLSEDIDLIAIGSRKAVANELSRRHPAGPVAPLGRVPNPASAAVGTRSHRLADGTPRFVPAVCGCSRC